MNNKKLILPALIILPGVLFAQKPKVKLKTDIDTVSYCLGISIGNNLKMAGFKSFNDKLFVEAISEIINDKETAYKPDQVDPIIRSYFLKIQAKKASENLIIGKKFLDDNRKAEGVVTLQSGLQYKIIKEGQGNPPSLTDKVTVNYTGSLISGKVFDSSVQRGQPAQFAVNAVIKGWTEALQLMKQELNGCFIFLPTWLMANKTSRA